MAEQEVIKYSFKPCIELDLIDCNCNNCIFMERDLEKYKKWKDWSKSLELIEFNRDKKKRIEEANSVIGLSNDDQDLRSGKGMLRVAKKMSFQFEKKYLLQYGKCKKFKKDISFHPDHCQIETQECFTHRRL